MNESPLDLVLLETFHEVARLGSLTAAAARLGRSQPALSHRLRVLEDDLGVPLFEKVGRRLVLTEWGRRLQRSCLDVMALARGVRASVCGDDGAIDGTVTVGALPTVVSHLLIPSVAALWARHGRLRTAFVLDRFAELLEQLRAGQLDLVVAVGEVGATRFDVDVIGSTGLVAVMAPALAPRRRGVVSRAELKARRYLDWSGPHDPTFDRVHRYAARSGLLDEHTPSVPHIESLRELAAAGAGYAILPAYTARSDVARGRLVALRPAGLDDRIPIALVRRRGQPVTPALRETVEAFRHAAASRT